MPRDALSQRENWQRDSSVRGTEAERAFGNAIVGHLSGSDIDVQYKPLDLAGIYGSQPSSSRPHGIHPEFRIRNKVNGHAIFVEVKRQRAAGNAHERACKYFAPGIIRSSRRIAQQPKHVIPFWWVFTNGIATHPRYRQEIQHWFMGIERHLLLWEDIENYGEVTQHFDRHIAPFLR